MPENARTSRGPRLLLLAAAVALVICVAGYALHWVAGGTAAGITALLLSGIAMSWLSEDGRRLRDGQDLAEIVPPTGALT